MPDELVDYVDENDQVLGQAFRSDIKARQLGAVRVASVLVYTDKGQIILGQMADRKAKNNQITFTASGHVQAGEDPLQAARRELGEEQGINEAFFKKLGVFKTYNKEGALKSFRYVYRVVTKKDLCPHPSEYKKNKIFTSLQLDLQILADQKQSPDKRKFYPAFAAVWNEIKNQDPLLQFMRRLAESGKGK